MVRYLELGFTLLTLLLRVLLVLSGRNNRLHDPNKLRVVSIEVAPYLTETDRGFRGYIKDVLDALVAELKIRYEIYLVPDKQFGYKIDRYHWNGMIKELIDNNADLAAAPLHKTFKRAEVVNFTTSILNISATMLMKIPEKGSATIKSLEDLEYFPDISVGTLNSGTIIRAFRTANTSTYINLWRRIENSNTLTRSNAKGIHEVRTSNGKFIYILPSDIAEYNKGELPCDLMTVGSFFPRTLNFAVQNDSYLKSKVDKVLYKFQQNGYLERLYNKWWIETRPCQSYTYTRPLKSSSDGQDSSHWILMSAIIIFYFKMTMAY